MTSFEDSLVRHLTARHRLHGIVLYGSRARGTHHADSDYDLLLLRTPGLAPRPTERDVHHLDGALVDAWLYDATPDPAAEPGLLRLHGARVLLDLHGAAAALLERVDEVANGQPKAMAPGDLAAYRVWLPKMLARLQGDDPLVAGHYRAELLHSLLPVWFEARRHWYRGTRQGAAWIREEAPDVARVFEAALRPNAELLALEAAVGALRQALDRAAVVVRDVTEEDVPAVVALVARVLPEFGLAFGHGSATDEAVQHLPGSFTERGGAFWVAVDSVDGRLLACAGAVPVAPGVLEIQKMYAAQEARGLGLGAELLARCEAFARGAGATTLVLDTTHAMTQAVRLYERSGFVRDDQQIRGSRCSMGFRKDLVQTARPSGS